MQLCQTLALSLSAPVPDLIKEVMTDKATHPIAVYPTGSSVMVGLKHKQAVKGSEFKLRGNKESGACSSSAVKQVICQLTATAKEKVQTKLSCTKTRPAGGMSLLVACRYWQ